MIECVPDNADLFELQEAEQARIHRLHERLAREERMVEMRLDEEMYEKWENERW